MSNKTTKEAAATAAKAVVETYGPPTRLIMRVVLLVIIILLVVALVLFVLYKTTGLLLLLVLSIFFAYLVSPLVEFLRRPRTIGKRTIAIPKAVSILLAYLIIMAVVVVAVYGILPSLSDQYPQFASQAREYWVSLGEKTRSIVEYSRSGRLPPRLVEAVNNAGTKVVDLVSGWATEFVTTALAYLVLYIPWLILIPILAFFLLKDAESFRRSALLMLPRGRWRWRGDEFFQDINTTLAAYIRAQLTASLLIGIICALGFTLLGLPGGLVMGVIAGVCEFVPLVGPLTVALMAAVLAVLHAGPFNAFLVLLFLGVLRIAQDYAIYPRLIGQGIHLHPLAVILAILAGEKLGGVPGVFLAIPFVAILTVSYRHWLEHRGSESIADVLEPSPPVPPIAPATEALNAATAPSGRQSGESDVPRRAVPAPLQDDTALK